MARVLVVDDGLFMCSGWARSPRVLEATKAGAEDFVVNPFQPDRVLDAVSKSAGVAADSSRSIPRPPKGGRDAYRDANPRGEVNPRPPAAEDPARTSAPSGLVGELSSTATTLAAALQQMDVGGGGQAGR